MWDANLQFTEESHFKGSKTSYLASLIEHNKVKWRTLIVFVETDQTQSVLVFFVE